MSKKQLQEVVNYLNEQLAAADQKWKDGVEKSQIVGYLEGSIQNAILQLGGEIKHKI